MTIKKKTVKDPPDFCFCCGKTLTKTEYVLGLGVPGATFELCRSCLVKIHTRATKALLPEVVK